MFNYRQVAVAPFCHPVSDVNNLLSLLLHPSQFACTNNKYFPILWVQKYRCGHKVGNIAFYSTMKYWLLKCQNMLYKSRVAKRQGLNVFLWRWKKANYRLKTEQ